MMSIIQELHDSEINTAHEALFDGAFTVRLGDGPNGYEAEATVGSWAEAEAWFRDRAIEIYPESNFARKASGRPVGRRMSMKTLRRKLPVDGAARSK